MRLNRPDVPVKQCECSCPQCGSCWAGRVALGRLYVLCFGRPLVFCPRCASKLMFCRPPKTELDTIGNLIESPPRNYKP